MNRQKIKEEAREKIKGNIWNILKPYIIVVLISFVVGLIGGLGDEENYAFMIFESIITIALYPLSFGCLVYILKFVRNEEYDLNLLFNQYKKFWPIFSMYFLISLFTTLWSLLLIIPGIIASLSYTVAPLIMADGEDDAMECIRKSKSMMNGYKWDYFKFSFSFIGWILLGVITFGLAYIYVIPYVLVSEVLYYEELKKINN